VLARVATALRNPLKPYVVGSLYTLGLGAGLLSALGVVAVSPATAELIATNFSAGGMNAAALGRLFTVCFGVSVLYSIILFGTLAFMRRRTSLLAPS